MERGDGDALDRLTPIVYHELRRLARHYMQQERAGHTLQSTALVHEAYTRLVDYKRMQWQSRAHFFAVAAQLMRRILVEHARRRQKVKRGAGLRHLTLDESVLADVHDPELVALDDALTELEKLDRRKVQVVEMRYFGGLSVEETAEVLKVSTVTVKRDALTFDLIVETDGVPDRDALQPPPSGEKLRDVVIAQIGRQARVQPGDILRHAVEEIRTDAAQQRIQDGFVDFSRPEGGGERRDILFRAGLDLRGDDRGMDPEGRVEAGMRQIKFARDRQRAAQFLDGL